MDDRRLAQAELRAGQALEHPHRGAGEPQRARLVPVADGVRQVGVVPGRRPGARLSTSRLGKRRRWLGAGHAGPTCFSRLRGPARGWFR
ncbi:hypothetical protein J2S46_008021 [Kitasatospora herbaricolor]|nr:hypothetical protein [Kitasatospora herbaricolor]